VVSASTSRLYAQAIAGCVGGTGELLSLAVSPISPHGAWVLTGVSIAGILLCACEMVLAQRLSQQGSTAIFHVVNLVGVAAVAIAIAVAPGFADALFVAAPLGIAAMFSSGRTVAAYFAAIIASCLTAELIAPTHRAGGNLVAVIFYAASIGGVLFWSRRQLERLAHTDPLCGIANRAGLDSRLHLEASRSRRSGEPLAVALLDIDGFKKINDTLGHAAGDEVLRRSTAAWASCLRQDDLLARLGGDEFVVLAVGADERRLASIVERMLGAGDVGASVGIARLGVGESIQDMLARADVAMFANKSARRLLPS